MRFITVPFAITIQPTPEAELAGFKAETFTWSKYARMCWLNDNRAIKDGFSKQIRWAAVVQKVNETKPGDLLELEDEDYNTLRSIVERPEMWLPPLASMQLISFSQAVLDAVPTKPAILNGAEDQAAVS